MSYEYAKLGSTCNTSMRVLLSNTKYIDPFYYEQESKKIDKKDTPMDSIKKGDVEIKENQEFDDSNSNPLSR